ncbi:MAG: D-alanyl-D-alanine carboxypeptidase family protein [Cohaesibacteraceae bacterium]
MPTAKPFALTALRSIVCLIVLIAILNIPRVALAQSTGLGPYDGPNITIDVDSMRVLSSNRAFDAWYPASTTKLMTAYVVFQAVREGRITMLSPVTISENAAAQPPSKAGLAVGQTLTVENALRVLMVKSANDIAVALAESVAGSEPAFIDEMNRLASALGMRRSTFTNPHGLPDRGQVTTAYDLALLTLALMRDYPEHNDFYSMGAVRLGQARWTNHNLLLQRYRGAFGFKTGYICDSGFNLVAGARRGGRTLINVTLGARSGIERAAATAHVLDDGFRQSGGLFGDPAGVPLVEFLPTGSEATEATRMRPIVCQRPRVRPSLEEIAGQFGTASPAFSASSSASAFSGDAGAVVLPSSNGGESDGAADVDVLDLVLGPIIRPPEPVRLSLGGATGPAVARLGRWQVPNPDSRPTSFAAALPGQIAPAGGTALVLAPGPDPQVAEAAPGAIARTVGRAVDRPVPSPVPRPF